MKTDYSRQSSCFAVVLSFQTAIFGQQTQLLITNTAGRETISVNGSWQVIIDPYENGYYDYRFQPRNDGYFKNAKPKSVSDLIEYDFDSSQQLQVPGDWNSQDQRLLSEVRASKFFYAEGVD